MSRRYVGRAGDNGVVVVYEGDDLVGPLQHRVVRHSPTGFAWGYGGSGPADLALNLIIDALGDEAWCPWCARQNRRGGCSVCFGDRLSPFARPHVYQAFKTAYVARWPQEDGWEITADEVVRFVHAMERSADAR